jgi:hypothetical protein
MSDNLKSMLSLVMVLAIIALPLLAPGTAIVLGAIGWFAYYFYLAAISISFDPMQHLPAVYDTTGGTVLSVLVVLTLIGAIRGLPGIMALLVVWGPLVLLPYYHVGLGTGVLHPEGWRGYRAQHWVRSECAAGNGPRRLDCELYVPKAGKRLPSFEETTGEGVTKIIPYGTRP